MKGDISEKKQMNWWIRAICSCQGWTWPGPSPTTLLIALLAASVPSQVRDNLQSWGTSWGTRLNQTVSMVRTGECTANCSFVRCRRFCMSCPIVFFDSGFHISSDIDMSRASWESVTAAGMSQSVGFSRFFLPELSFVSPMSWPSFNEHRPSVPMPKTASGSRRWKRWTTVWPMAWSQRWSPTTPPSTAHLGVNRWEPPKGFVMSTWWLWTYRWRHRTKRGHGWWHCSCSVWWAIWFWNQQWWAIRVSSKVSLGPLLGFYWLRPKSIGWQTWWCTILQSVHVRGICSGNRRWHFCKKPISWLWILISFPSIQLSAHLAKLNTGGKLCMSWWNWNWPVLSRIFYFSFYG